LNRQLLVDSPARSPAWSCSTRPAGGGVQPAGERAAAAPRNRHNKNDRFDAFVLADALRTDASRLRPLVADAAATLGLRALIRASKDLIPATPPPARPPPGLQRGQAPDRAA
jgi:hypothetical protein